MLDMVSSNRCLYDEVNKHPAYKKYHFQTSTLLSNEFTFAAPVIPCHTILLHPMPGLHKKHIPMDYD